MTKTEILKNFKKKFPILLDQGGEWGGRPILTDNVTNEVFKWLSTSLDQVREQTLKEALKEWKKLPVNSLYSQSYVKKFLTKLKGEKSE